MVVLLGRVRIRPRPHIVGPRPTNTTRAVDIRTNSPSSCPSANDTTPIHRVWSLIENHCCTGSGKMLPQLGVQHHTVFRTTRALPGCMHRQSQLYVPHAGEQRARPRPEQRDKESERAKDNRVRVRAPPRRSGPLCANAAWLWLSALLRSARPIHETEPGKGPVPPPPLALLAHSAVIGTGTSSCGLQP